MVSGTNTLPILLTPVSCLTELLWTRLVVPTQIINAQLDRCLGNLEVKATPGTLFENVSSNHSLRMVPQIILEQSVQCHVVYIILLEEGTAVQEAVLWMKGCTSSEVMFG